MKPTSSLPFSQGPVSFADRVQALLDASREEIVRFIETFLREPTPSAFLDMEETVQKLLSRAGGYVVALIVRLLAEDPIFVLEATEKARDSDQRKLRNQGRRLTSVRFLGGVVLCLWTRYLSPDHGGSSHSRRRKSQRGKAGGGVFPVLLALGILHRATPALASLTARLSARCSSFEEAGEALAEQGIEMDAKAVHRLTLHVGEEALRQRDRRMAAAEEGGSITGEFAGKRIVISVDGGRIRLREGGKRGRRNKAGHRRYETPWKEPKILTVYVIDDTGRKDTSCRPLLDGTLKDADATFRLLISELLLRGASKAEEIIVTGDGAPWIWNRVDALAPALGLSPEKIVRVADFYHAVEHLAEIAELIRSFGEVAKKRWVIRMRRRLKKGKVDEVIESAVRHCRGRYAKKIATQIDYFRKRRELMRYDEFAARGIPLGSGAVESAVRRVVNLRLKGPAIFWREASAEAMLHLRAYLKAGRWDEIVNRVIHRSPNGTTGQFQKAAA